MKKILSLVLALVMVVGLVPWMAGPAVALDSSGIERFLLRGFNVFSGDELRIENLTTTNILKPGANLGGNYGTDLIADTYTEAFSGRTIEDLAIKAGIDLTVSASASGGIGELFKASAKRKFSISASAAYRTAYDSYFFQSSVIRKIGKAFINDLDTINAVQSQLDENFLNELITAKDIEGFFNKYGTHVLTSYVVGGWAEFQVSSMNKTESIDTTLKAAYESAASFSIDTETINTELDLITNITTNFNNSNYSHSATARIIGGTGGIPNFINTNESVASTYSAWTNTVTAEEGKHEILTDKNLILTGIWELLPAGQGERYAELCREYVRLAIEHNLDFCNEFIYRQVSNGTEAVVDDVSSVEVYNNTPIQITTAEEFASIGFAGFPRNGNYVLMNDISLGTVTSYGLVTAGGEFTGTFDGNGKTIENYTHRRSGDFRNYPAETNAGLFPIIGTGGVVKNLQVKSSSVDYDSDGNQIGHNVTFRVGIIAGLNKGRIENCQVSESEARVWIYRNANANIYSGGIAGENRGIIKGCSFTNGTIKSQTKNNNSGRILAAAVGQKSEVRCHAGGIAGSSSGEISDCYAFTSTHSRGAGAFMNNTNAYLYAGGIVGLLTSSGKIIRSFAEGTEQTTKDYTSDKERLTGKIIGKREAPAGNVLDCFVQGSNTQGAVGYAANNPQGGVTAVASFRVSSIVDKLTQTTGSVWEYKNNAHPVHKTYEPNPPVFIVEYLNGKPQYHVGDVLNAQDLSAMKIYFTPNEYTIATKEITNNVKILYSFSEEGKGAIQFLYREDTGGTVKNYYGSLQVPITEKHITIDGVKPTGMSLNGSTATISEGGEISLIAVFTPAYANVAVTWSSSDEEIAVVNSDGEVYAQAVGTAIITAATENGEFFAQCIVTVIPVDNSEDIPSGAGIDYEGVVEVIITGVTFSFNSGKTIPADATPNSNATINLTTEALALNGFSIEAYSIDGGTTWKAGRYPDKEFIKLLNKGGELWLCYKDYNSNAKKPQGSGNEHNIIAFAKINKRPTAPKLVINYEIAADKTGTTPGQWVLTEKNGSTAVKDKIEVGAAAANKKTVDANGYGRFFDGAANGIPVQALTGTKATKTTYFIRTTPSQNGSEYTAAGKARKINVTSEQKAPTYKVNAKAETKTKPESAIIKVKANTYVAMGGEIKLYTSKADIDVLNYTGLIELWQAATAKKAATAKQTITR